MPIHKHLICAAEHRAFLDQERIDPITGEAIRTGDEVVFCASCKSAFLADSWNYLEGQHCNQSDTLAEFPPQQSLSFTYASIRLEDFPLEGILFSNYTRSDREVELTLDDFLVRWLKRPYGALQIVLAPLLTGGILLFWVNGGLPDPEDNRGWAIPFVMLVLAAMGFGMTAVAALPVLVARFVDFVEQVRNGLSDERGRISIYTNGLRINATGSLLGKGWTARFKDVRKITFLQQKTRWGSTKTYLKVHLRDRRTQRIRLSSDPGVLRSCLWALQKIGYFVDIELGLKGKSEINFVNTLTRRYAAHFRILPDEERLRLLQE